MISNNLNNTQNKFNSFSKLNENMYLDLINEFETYLLAENKKLAMIDYLKNNCDINFSNDVVNVLENFNYVISQAIQAIRTLLSKNENLEGKKLNNEYNNYYNKSYYNNNISNSGYNFKNNFNCNYNYNYNNNSNNCSMNFNNLNFNDSNSNNYNYNNNLENKPNPLKYDYNIGIENNNHEPLKKPLREQLKNLSKENSTNNFNINNSTNNSNTIINNLNNYSNDGKNSLRMVINNQIPNLNNSNNNILDNYSVNNSLNNQNLSFYNSNKKMYESNSNNNVKEIIKKREIDIIKVTNQILKLINIANKKKNYLVEKYVNPSSLNYNNDYKEFLDRIINYKYDIITLNNILKDLNDYRLNSPQKFNSYKKKFNPKGKIKNQITGEETITEANEAFKKKLRKYSYPSTKKPPFINATNPYGHLFS